MIAQLLVARFQRENRRGLFAQFFLELNDGIGLLAEFGELAGGLGLHLVDAHFESPRRHGELGAQLILIGADFGNRKRCGRFQPPHGQADSAVMNEWNEQSPSNAATRNPIPKYMIGSIMTPLSEAVPPPSSSHRHTQRTLHDINR